MRNWKYVLLSAAMITSFSADVYAAKFVDKIKSGVKKVKNKFKNKYAMDSKDAKKLKKAMSPISELGVTIKGMKNFVKLVKNMPKKAGVVDGVFQEKISEASEEVAEDIESLNLNKASGTLKSIFTDLYKSIKEAIKTVSNLVKAYDVRDKKDQDATKKKEIYKKLTAIRDGLKKMSEAMQDKLEPKKASKIKSDEDDEEE